MPRWLLVLAAFVIALVSTGITLGVKLQAGEARLIKMSETDAYISVRVDTLRRDVDSIQRRGADDSKILRAIGRKMCRDLDPRTADDFELPCVTLRPNGSTSLQRGTRW